MVADLYGICIYLPAAYCHLNLDVIKANLLAAGFSAVPDLTYIFFSNIVFGDPQNNLILTSISKILENRIEGQSCRLGSLICYICQVVLASGVGCLSGGKHSLC